MPRKWKIRCSFVGGRRPRFSDYGTADDKAELPVPDQQNEHTDTESKDVEELVTESITKNDAETTSNKIENKVVQGETSSMNKDEKGATLDYVCGRNPIDRQTQNEVKGIVNNQTKTLDVKIKHVLPELEAELETWRELKTNYVHPLVENDTDVETNDKDLEKLSETQKEVLDLHGQLEAKNNRLADLHKLLTAKKERLANSIGCQTINVDSTLNGNLTQTICETPRQWIKKITNLK